jgi:uncharacterized protein YjiS (DUF1127 family)
MAFESHRTVGLGGGALRAETRASTSTMVGCLLSLFAGWQDRAVGRRRGYERINDHLMRDIGLMPVDIAALGRVDTYLSHKTIAARVTTAR